MKKLVFVVSIFVMAFFIACGNGDAKKEEIGKKEKDYVYETEYIVAELGEGWADSADGAKSHGGCNAISYTVEKVENMNDLFDNTLEQVGAVSDTTVDGLPAVTRVEKYAKKDPPMIGRIWFIDNGSNIIVFNAFAALDVFDDNIAKEIVGYVKIKKNK